MPNYTRCVGRREYDEEKLKDKWIVERYARVGKSLLDCEAGPPEPTCHPFPQWSMLTECHMILCALPAAVHSASLELLLYVVQM
jgi:hypothetical protein